MRTKIAKNVKRKKPVTGMLEKRFKKWVGGWNTHERTDIDKDKDFKWTDAGGALMGYTKDQVEQQRKHNKRRKEN